MSTRGDRIRQRYVCTECGSPSTVQVAPVDRDQTIGYVCSGECGGVTEHEPAGATYWFDTTD